MNKTEMRKTMRVLRDSLVQREEKSKQICENILSMPEYVHAQCVMLYHPIRSEANLLAIAEMAVKQGKRVCLPVCRENGEMDAVFYTGMECMCTNAFGVKEPQGSVVPPECIDLVFCPGLAFDAQGCRLGYGKGYYDRYLEKVHAFLVGVCYTECVMDQVPANAHDKAMNAVVTQQGILRMGGDKE